MIQISELHVYPIKSCGGIRVDSVSVDRTGFVGDRRLMLVDSDGRFQTLREHPRLWLVQPEQRDAGLCLTAPEMPALEFTPINDGPPQPAVIWKDAVEVCIQSEAVNEWFSDYLGKSVRLASLHETYQRPVDSQYAVSESDSVNLADGYPILVISEAALDGLNARLDDPVRMRRFRPNLVVTGCGAHAEDEWREVKIGAVPATGVKRCARCEILTLDPVTTEVSKRATIQLAEYRRAERGILFGMNLIPQATGTVSVGDTVEVLSTHTSLP